MIKELNLLKTYLGFSVGFIQCTETLQLFSIRHFEYDIIQFEGTIPIGKVWQ
jgi:hypothetical protein